MDSRMDDVVLGCCDACDKKHSDIKVSGVFSKTDVPVQLYIATYTKSLRARYEGPSVWRAHRAGRCLFPTQRPSPCFLTFVRRGRVQSQTFEGGIDAPRFLVSEWFIGIWIDRVMSARNAGARYKLV